MEKPKISMELDFDTTEALKKIEEVVKKLESLNIPNIVIKIETINVNVKN